MSDTLDHNEDDLLAAELALGVLEGAERTTAVHRATRDRAFARLVEEWEQRLAPWAGEIREVSPSPEVWDRISSATARNRLWHSLNFWRGSSFAAGAFAAACRRRVIPEAPERLKKPLRRSVISSIAKHPPERSTQ